MSIIPAWYVLHRGRERREASPSPPDPRVHIELDAAAVELLRDILQEWCSEGFTTTAPRLAFAEQLLADLPPEKREHEQGHR